MSPKNGNAAYIAATRNVLTPENLALLIAALAAPVAAGAERGLLLSSEVIGRLRKDAARLLPEKQWRSLCESGDMDAAAAQGRAALAKELLALAASLTA